MCVYIQKRKSIPQKRKSQNDIYIYICHSGISFFCGIEQGDHGRRGAGGERAGGRRGMGGGGGVCMGL